MLLKRGVEVVATDARAAGELELGGLSTAPGLELRLGREERELPRGIDALVVSPGVALGHPLVVAARAAGVPVAAEVELAYAFLSGPVIAVTGSNGKSTTTAMAGALLAAAGHAVEVCGNIGLPLSRVVDGAPGRIFVVELSSFQLETIHRFHARAAAFLNLSPDHLDRHGDLAVYLAAKRRVFENQTAGDTAVLNADEREVATTPVAARRRTFSLGGEVEDGCVVEDGRVIERVPGATDVELFAVADVPLRGPHNLENAMAAALLARAVGAPIAVLAPALRGFRGLPHRLEPVAERAGVTYFDDSKGTNVAATARSLEGFADGSVHLILGGRNKGADLAYLRPIVARKAARVYLIGESAGLFATVLAGAVELSQSGTLARAVAEAAERARPGDSVVLSPACASFDQFRDYADRGRQFRALARAAVGKGA
jgi:UDP-N-acetylmuramoylalanine--D-glutamate ligase